MSAEHGSEVWISNQDSARLYMSEKLSEWTGVGGNLTTSSIVVTFTGLHKYMYEYQLRPLEL